MDFDRKNKTGCPCNTCTEETGRHPGCHDHCEDRYKPWKKKLDERNEAERKYRKQNDTMSESGKRDMWRNKRYSRQVRFNKHTRND